MPRARAPLAQLEARELELAAEKGELAAKAERLQQQLREAQAAALLGDNDGTPAEEAAEALERELGEAREAAAKVSSSRKVVIGGKGLPR